MRGSSHLVASLLLASGCTRNPADRPATWSYLHAAIVAPSCATSSCHGEIAETAGVVLDDADSSYVELIDRNFVVPGDLGSPLLSLLEADERPRMPPDAPLPAADIDLFAIWIEEGAPR